jgi:hypothetical protein
MSPSDYELVEQGYDPPVDEVRAALQGLVDRLDEINANSAFKNVWTMHHVHGGDYRGPTWVDALERARAALNGATTSPAPSSDPGPARSTPTRPSGA